MKFLKIIATPFIRIGRWIKETAWVQPLLIVGCIFAVIFSIPYIVRGIQNLSSGEDDNMAYYNDRKISMLGAYDRKGDAYDFLTSFEEVSIAFTSYQMNHENEEYNSSEDMAVIDDFVDTYGEKFFFVLSKDGCDACDALSSAFQYLEDNASTYSVTGLDVKTIITDEDMGDEADEYKNTSAFEELYNSTSGAFDQFYSAGYYGSYYSANISDVSGYRTNLDTLHAEDINNMQVPLLVLIDLSKNYDEANNFVGFNNQSLYAASQVLFSVDGDTDGEKSIQLANCWNYTGDLFSYRNTSNN